MKFTINIAGLGLELQKVWGKEEKILILYSYVMVACTEKAITDIDYPDIVPQNYTSKSRSK